MTAQFLKKLCLSFDGGNKVILLFIAFLEERKYVEKLGRIRDDLSPLIVFSLQAMQRNPTLVLQSQKKA